MAESPTPEHALASHILPLHITGAVGHGGHYHSQSPESFFTHVPGLKVGPAQHPNQCSLSFNLVVAAYTAVDTGVQWAFPHKAGQVHVCRQQSQLTLPATVASPCSLEALHPILCNQQQHHLCRQYFAAIFSPDLFTPPLGCDAQQPC
jgi:hypothetical protein